MASIKENNLGLNYGWTYGESGWNSGMDENIVKLGFESRKRVNGILSSPPSSSPSNGDAYIVGTAPTGLFSGKSANIAIYDRGSWVFITPKSQEVVFNTSDGCDYIYNNGWSLKLEAEVSPYIKIKDFTFSTGYTITDQKQCLLNIADNKYYQWTGSLPKVVAAGSTPATSGGIRSGAWVALSSSTGSTGSTGIFIYKFTAIDGQTEFTIGNAVSPGTVPIVFKRGVYQENGESYTISDSDGRTFIFSEPMVAGDKIQIIAMSGADNIIKGDYQDFIYRNSDFIPSTPTGPNPSGWTPSPQNPTAGQFTWVSTARKNGNSNSLIGTWSVPSRLSGEVGLQGASVVDVVEVSSDAASTTYKMLLSNGQFTSDYVIPKGIQGEQGEKGDQGDQGRQGVSIVDVDEVSSDSSSITYRLELSNGSFTSNYTLPKGVSVQDIELVSKVGKTATYRFLLSDSTYTDMFDVLDGLDGLGSVVSVNGVSPGVGGNVTLTAADVGADATGSATTAVSNHVAQGDPHLQYDYRWLNSTANTGVITGSTRCRWLVDTTTTRNRTIGVDVRDLLVKDITGKASTNNITITAPSGKTINGAATETIDVNYGWVQYVLVGTDFKTIGGK